MRQNVVNASFEAYADERVEIGCRDDTAFVLLFGPMLDESVDRNDEEPSGEPQQGKKDHYGDEANAVEGQQRAKDGHADGAEGDQAVFDLASGEITGGEAANTDANGYGGLQECGMCFVDLQNVVAIHYYVNLKQPTEKPEIG